MAINCYKRLTATWSNSIGTNSFNFRRTDSPWGYLPCIKSETLSDIESVPTDTEKPNPKKTSVRTFSRDSNSSRRKKQSNDAGTNSVQASGTANAEGVPPNASAAGKSEGSGFGSRLSPTTRRKSFRNSKKWRKVQQSESNSLENEKNVALNFSAQSNVPTSTAQPAANTMASLFNRPVPRHDDSNDLTVASSWSQRSASARQKKRSSASPSSSNLSSGRNSIWNSQTDKLTSLAPPPMQYHRGGGSFRRGSSFRSRRKDCGSDPNSRFSSRQNSTTQSSFDYNNSFDDPDLVRGRVTVFEKWTNDLKRAFIRGKPTLGSGSVNSPTSQDSTTSMKAFQRYIAKATSLSGKRI